MRFLLFTIFTAILTLLPYGPVSAGISTDFGAQAPSFSARDAQGRLHDLDDYRGQVVVLEWTSHECPYTEKYYTTGKMQEMQKEARNHGIVWFSIVSSAPGEQGYVSADEARKIVKERAAMPSAVLLDPAGDMARSYGAKVTPHMYIIDQAGNLAYSGAIDSNVSARLDADGRPVKEFFRTALEQVMAGQDVSRPMTRAFGCSIKMQ